MNRCRTPSCLGLRLTQPLSSLTRAPPQRKVPPHTGLWAVPIARGRSVPPSSAPLMCGGKGGPRTGCCSFAVGLSDSVLRRADAPHPRTDRPAGVQQRVRRCRRRRRSGRRRIDGRSAGLGHHYRTQRCGMARSMDLSTITTLVCFFPSSSSSSCVRMVSLQRPVPRPTCIPTCIGGMHWRFGGASLLPALSLTIQQRTVCLDGWVLICLSRAYTNQIICVWGSGITANDVAPPRDRRAVLGARSGLSPARSLARNRAYIRLLSPPTAATIWATCAARGSRPSRQQRTPHAAARQLRQMMSRA